jgi:hypothetical protein
MEAALRTAYHTLNRQGARRSNSLPSAAKKPSRKPKSIWAKRHKVKVAVTSGMANAKPLTRSSPGGQIALRLHRDHVLPRRLHQWRRSTLREAFFASERRRDILDTYRAKRANILYSIDEKKCVVRQSHNNPDIIRLYKDYLGKPATADRPRKPKSFSLHTTDRARHFARHFAASLPSMYTARWHLARTLPDISAATITSFRLRTPIT